MITGITQIAVLEAEESFSNFLIAGDYVSLGLLLSDTLVYEHSGGAIEDKDGFLANMAKYRFLNAHRGPLDISIEGDQAVAIGAFALTVVVPGSSTPVNKDVTSSRTWTIDEGRCVLVDCRNAIYP